MSSNSSNGRSKVGTREIGRWAAPLLFLGFAFISTWPWILHPGSTLPAVIGGDVSISIAKFQVMANEGTNPFVLMHMRTIGWPDGVATTPGVDIVSFLSTGFLLLGSHVFGSIAAHGILAILSYLLTGWVTYGFVTEVTGSRMAGFVAGAAYAAASNLTINVWAVTVYAQGWLFILPMWAFWRLAMRPSRRAALLAGLSFVPSLFWTPYFALHCGVVSAACLMGYVVARVRDDAPLRRRLVYGAQAVAVWVVASAAYLGTQLLTEFGDVPQRDLQDHYDKSAHPLGYLIPGQFSDTWGTAGYEWLIEKVPRMLELNLYLGWVVLTLGAIASVAAVAPLTRRRALRLSGTQVAVLMGFLVAIACFLFSMPPKVLGGNVPMPGLLVQKFAPVFRTPLRFVMPLMAGSSVLAGLGAWVVLRRLSSRPQWQAITLTAILALAIAVDSHITPNDSWVPAPPSFPALAELDKQPEGPAIHWLNNGFEHSPAPWACFLQQQHRMTLANACAVRLDRPPRLESWTAMPVCDALRDMRKTGIRYVIAENVRSDVLGCFEQREAGSFREIGRDFRLVVLEFV